jgi:hypothetical protein
VGEDGLPETFEDKDEGELEDSASEGGTFQMDGSLPIKGPSERYGIFSKFHNSSVGHFGITRTLEAMTKAGHGWMGMRKDVTDWINECGVCQKIKYQRDPNWEDEVEHHLYTLDPLHTLSLDTLGPLPEDELGYKYIILIMDYFSKFVGLYPSKSTTAKECVEALLQWISIFGVPVMIRTDGGSQFHNSMVEEFAKMMNFQHQIVVAYHPQANGLAERRMAEVMKHLRALVFTNRIKEYWSRYLPLVQRIMNYTIDGSIGTQPARVLLGDIAGSELAMAVPQGDERQDSHAFLIKLREAQAILMKTTQDFLRLKQRKRVRDGLGVPSQALNYHEGQFVLLKYPNRPPNKLAGLYRGPLVIEGIVRPDLIKVRDLLSNAISLVHTSRLRPFRHPANMTLEEAIALAAADMDEFFVEKIIRHAGPGNNPKRWKYLVRWLGYEEGDDQWLSWAAVKDLEALQVYADANGIKLPEESSRSGK